MNLLFRPIGIVAGILAGIAARKIFDQSWKAVDGRRPPEAEERGISPVKLVASLALEGMIFSVVRGVVDHYTRVAFFRYTGAWPGEDNTDET